MFRCLGRRFHAKADGDTDEVVDPPKVEEKIGAVPHGLSTDSDIVKRFVNVQSYRCAISPVDSPFREVFNVSFHELWFQGVGVDVEKIYSQQCGEI